jgi:hypothetical protein
LILIDIIHIFFLFLTRSHFKKPTGYSPRIAKTPWRAIRKEGTIPRGVGSDEAGNASASAFHCAATAPA